MAQGQKKGAPYGAPTRTCQACGLPIVYAQQHASWVHVATIQEVSEASGERRVPFRHQATAGEEP